MADLWKRLEQRKYQEVWEHDEYRKFSPGKLEHHRALSVMDMLPGDTITDFGCGEGWSVKFFSDKGMDAFGVDIASNAIRAPGIVVVEACLWDLGDIMRSDFGFCCDVMEHIPTAKVRDTLENIAAHVRTACYFRISTEPDHFGPKLIGKPLHLTVASADSWRKVLEKFFDAVMTVDKKPGHVVFLASRPLPSRASSDHLYTASEEVDVGDGDSEPHDMFTGIRRAAEA